MSTERGIKVRDLLLCNSKDKTNKDHLITVRKPTGKYSLCRLMSKHDTISHLLRYEMKNIVELVRYYATLILIE